MSRDWLLYVDDMIASGEKIARFVRGKTAASLATDEAVFDAVLFNLQVIGEAIKNLPEDVKSATPAFAGSGPRRLRDLIAHHYFAVDPEIIWGVVTEHVPQLLSAARVLRDRSDRG